MDLTRKDKTYLSSIGYSEKDFGQIQEAINKSTFAIFKEGDVDHCVVINNEKARKLLGDEAFLGGIARSAFHFSSSKEIPRTFEKFSLSMDSGILFSNSKSKLLEKHCDFMSFEDVEKIASTPTLYVHGIEWDTSDDDYDEDIDWEDVGLKDYMFIPVEKCPNIADLEGVSDYLSNETGFCQKGFYVDCNYTIEEIYAKIENIDSDLEEEYKDGETVQASNLECYKEELESLVCILEENEQELSIE